MIGPPELPLWIFTVRRLHEASVVTSCTERGTRWAGERERNPPETGSLNPAVGTPKENAPDGLEDEVGQPENQMGCEFRPCLQRLTDDDEAIVNE